MTIEKRPNISPKVTCNVGKMSQKRWLLTEGLLSTDGPDNRPPQHRNALIPGYTWKNEAYIDRGWAPMSERSLSKKQARCTPVLAPMAAGVSENVDQDGLKFVGE